MPPSSALAPYVGPPGLGIQIEQGLVGVSGSIYALIATKAPLAPNSTNYVYLTLSPTVAIAVNQSGFPSTNSFPIAVALTNQNSVVNMQDYRPDWNFGSSSGGGGGGTPAVASVTLPNQTGSIGVTPLYTPGVSQGGMYAVYADVIVTQIGGAGTVQTLISWSNGSNSPVQESAPFPLTAIGEQSSLIGNFYVPAGQTITYQTTVTGATGSPVYQLALRLVYLG